MGGQPILSGLVPSVETFMIDKAMPNYVALKRKTTVNDLGLQPLKEKEAYSKND